MFAASIYFYNNIKQCTRRATMTPRLWRRTRGEEGEGEIKRENNREKKRRR